MAKEYKNLQKALETVGRESIIYLTKILKENDKVATGSLIKSLDFKIIKGVNGLMLAIMADKTLDYVDEGRYPYHGKNYKPNYKSKPQGKWVPVAPIMKWVSVKGFASNPKSAAYAISRSIAYKGIKPLLICDKMIKDIIYKKYDLISKGGVEDIQLLIDNIFDKKTFG